MKIQPPRVSVTISVVAVALLLSACSDCQEVAAPGITSSVTCHDVLGGEYQACYGPRWNSPVTKLCTAYDGYVIELVKPAEDGSKLVIASRDVDYRAPLAAFGIHTSPRLHSVHLDSNEVCFEVAEPEICFKAEENEVQRRFLRGDRDPVEIAARTREMISEIRRSPTGIGFTVAERLNILSGYGEDDYIWTSRHNEKGSEVETTVNYKGREITLKWLVSDENIVTPVDSATQRFMQEGKL